MNNSISIQSQSIVSSWSPSGHGQMLTLYNDNKYSKIYVTLSIGISGKTELSEVTNLAKVKPDEVLKSLF